MKWEVGSDIIAMMDCGVIAKKNGKIINSRKYKILIKNGGKK
ncbi:hypothetical protein ACY1J9_001346 [Clostridium botulinum]